MVVPTLTLIPVYLAVSAGLMRTLTDRLSQALRTQVRVQTPGFDPERAFDVGRGQYHSTLLLELLLRDTAKQGGRVLGVTGVDLFVPVLTYVFGEAQLDGRAAVVSAFRLDTQLYGLPADEALWLERLEKECLHELGHTFGLVHCINKKCVMQSSTYVEQIDLKGADFCASCRPALGHSETGA